MTRNQVYCVAGAMLWSLFLGFTVAWAVKSTLPEPETWCSKRVYNFYLVGEKLDLVSYNDEDLIAYGTLTCKYERQPRKHDPERAADATQVRKK